jgi:uncharacterized protein (UPF0333 family)
MKLKKVHLFLILLLTLILCCGLGAFRIKEGMNNNTSSSTSTNSQHNNNQTTYSSYSDKQNGYYNRYDNGSGNGSGNDSGNGSNDNYSPQSTINGNTYSSNSNSNNTNEISKSVTLNDGRVIYATPQNTVNGILGKNIPPGQEDLYILKSQVIPPVCPACPTVINTCNGGNKECPACPPCGRCPEAAFECVKRPTYKPDNPYLPVPILSDFSSFGM